MKGTELFKKKKSSELGMFEIQLENYVNMSNFLKLSEKYFMCKMWIIIPTYKIIFSMFSIISNIPNI